MAIPGPFLCLCSEFSLLHFRFCTACNLIPSFIYIYIFVIFHTLADDVVRCDETLVYRSFLLFNGFVSCFILDTNICPKITIPTWFLNCNYFLAAMRSCAIEFRSSALPCPQDIIPVADMAVIIHRDSFRT